MHRDHWQREIAKLDPQAQASEIYRITATLEFPWDMNQALGLALFRTYAVPSIGQLLADTGEFTQRTQKRYDDTALLLDAVLDNGMDAPGGRAAVRRMNQMHRAHGIGVDDLRYVLATFVVVPARWMEDFGWRPLSETELIASTHHYRALGRRMGISAIPDSYQGFCDLLDGYEAEHFAYSDGGRAVADATLALQATFPPYSSLPARLVKRLSYALMDEPLLDAFHYPRPTAAERVVARAGLLTRAAALRRMKPRTTPMRARDFSWIRSYPRDSTSTRSGPFPSAAPRSRPKSPAPSR